MNRRTNIRLLARRWLSLESTARTCRAQRIAVHAPDVVVVRTGALETIVVVRLECIEVALIRLA